MKTIEMKTDAPAEFDTYLPFQAEPFTVSGDLEVVEALHKAVANKTYKVPVEDKKPVLEPAHASEPMLPTYTPATMRTKIKDWLSDAEWRRVDKELGTNIVEERKAQRLAQRVLVARVAAGVENPPVWGKYKTALKLAERALAE